jgi:hypothetical protein
MTPAAQEGAGSSDRKIRITVDLTRDQHRFVRRFAFDADADASSVFRVLLSLLEEDAKLAKRVLERVERKYL